MGLTLETYHDFALLTGSWGSTFVIALDAGRPAVLNVCFITPTFIPTTGGTEEFIRRLGTGLRERGHQVRVVTSRVEGGSKRETIDGLDVERSYFPASLSGIVPLQASLLLRLLSLRQQIDIFHQFHVFHLGGAVTFSRYLGCKPLITTLCGWDTFDPVRPVPNWSKPYIRFCLDASDLVVAISEELAGRARDQGYSGPLEVAHLASDVDRFHPRIDGTAIRNRYGISSDDVLGFALQRMDQRKRVSILIQAMARCRHHAPKLKLLVGGHGPLAAEVEQLSQELNLADRVIFTGFIPNEDLPAYYAAADFFVLHSTYEAFGLVLADAMAVGKPIVSTSVGAIPEVAPPGEASILVSPEAPAELADAMIRMATAPKLRLRLGEGAKRRSRTIGSWHRIVDSYERWYLERMEN